jgi:hypothetical protein
VSERRAEGGPPAPDPTALEAVARRDALRAGMANPDDPFPPQPPLDTRARASSADHRGALGRVAIVQAQVYLVGAIVIAQLFLITTALYELLSGHTAVLWWIALAALIGFLLALVIALWPRRRILDY